MKKADEDSVGRMRQESRDGWESYPFRLRISHNGEYWIIQFIAENADPCIEDDCQTVRLPGYFRPERVKEHLNGIPETIRSCCINFERVTTPNELKRIFLGVYSSEIVSELTAKAERVQGKLPI